MGEAQAAAGAEAEDLTVQGHRIGPCLVHEHAECMERLAQVPEVQDKRLALGVGPVLRNCKALKAGADVVLRMPVDILVKGVAREGTDLAGLLHA